MFKPGDLSYHYPTHTSSFKPHTSSLRRFILVMLGKPLLLSFILLAGLGLVIYFGGGS